MTGLNIEKSTEINLDIRLSIIYCMLKKELELESRISILDLFFQSLQIGMKDDDHCPILAQGIVWHVGHIEQISTTARFHAEWIERPFRHRSSVFLCKYSKEDLLEYANVLDKLVRKHAQRYQDLASLKQYARYKGVKGMEPEDQKENYERSFETNISLINKI